MTNDLYKPAIKPWNLKASKKESDFAKLEREKARFCLNHCPHPDKPCSNSCKEYKRKFGG